ncbi:MAG: hypothetical protein WCT04_04830 [Planctomycetota bacterium]
MTTQPPEKSGTGRITAWLERPLFVFCALVMCAGIVVRANLNAPFCKFDDAIHLKVATEDPLPVLFSISNEQTLLPVSMLALRLDRLLFGPSLDKVLFVQEGGQAHPLDDYYMESPTAWAFGTRVTNALCHVLAGLLLWRLLLRLKASPGIAFWVAAVWTAHPMACESVCWISEKKNVLAAVFGFAALLAWCWETAAWKRVSLACVLMVLACGSKPTAVGFLPVFFALEYLLERERRTALSEPSSTAQFWLGAAARLAFPAAICAVFIVLNLQIHQVYFVEHAGGSLYTAMLTDIEIFARYIANIVAPSNLSMFYGLEPILSLGDPRVWWFGGFIVAFCALCIWAAQGHERLLAALGVFWFFAALGPAANIATIPYWMQDRYAYFSAPGLLLAFGCGARGMILRAHRESLMRPLATLFFVFIAVSAFFRSAVYVDSNTFFFDAVERQPLSGMAQLYAFKFHSIESFKAAKSGTPDAEKRAQEEMALAFYYYQRSLKCPDLTNFRSEFDLRVMMADHLMASQNLSLAKECLEGWVPPAHLTVREKGKKYTAASMKTFYEPGTMALAWVIQSDIRLREASQSGLGTTKQAFDMRRRLLTEASDCIDKAAALRDWKTKLDEQRAKIATVRARIEKDAEAIK